MSDPFDTLFHAADPRNCAPGELLFHTGDPVTRVYRVRSGRVALRRNTPDGTELTLQIAGPGEVAAEASAYSEAYHCDAVALEPSVVECLPRDTLRAALRESPELAEAWARRLTRAVQAARMRAEIRSLRTVAERLDVWLATRGALPDKGRWQELATELGVTREALYRELARRRGGPAG
ncbi:Crp/Fnr family transcriptional regulator [Acidimangrovimonas pyrenivorans]|uniref:Crp/Fnr family transcriptional regulator n=2 Tax=Acidimangrovimonas pyrenivorans TaxID=2030798 RepID=A0ABV7AM82_9RHOB